MLFEQSLEVKPSRQRQMGNLMLPMHKPLNHTLKIQNDSYLKLQSLDEHGEIHSTRLLFLGFPLTNCVCFGAISHDLPTVDLIN